MHLLSIHYPTTEYNEIFFDRLIGRWTDRPVVY